MQQKWIFLPAVFLGLSLCLTLPAQANEGFVSEQAKRTTTSAEEIYNLNYVPPLYGSAGAITPEVHLKRSGSSISGSSVYTEGWCGNEKPQIEKMTGKWVGRELKVTMVSSTGKETLDGVLDPNSGIIVGKSSNKRLFALIKKTKGASNLTPKMDKDKYAGQSEALNALDLEKEARRQSVSNPKLAEATWLKALSLWDKLPPNDLGRIEARIRLAKFYCSNKYDLTDIKKSPEACKMFSEVSTMVAAQEQSKEASADPARWVEILKELNWFYDRTADSEKSGKTFSQMLSWMKRIPNNPVGIAKALDHRANQLSKKNPAESERLKLQALSLWNAQADKNLTVKAYYRIIDWYRSKNQFDEAENRTRELAKSVGLTPADVQFGSDFRKRKG